MDIDFKKADEAVKQGAAFNLDEDTLAGFEDVDSSTMAVPFIRILQKLSPQLNKQKDEYVEGANVGDFINTLTQEVYGPSVAAIVLKFERVFIEWKPNRGGFAGYHTPENAERIAVDRTFGKWKTKDGNDLQENFVYFLIMPGHEKDGVCVMSLSSSAIKMGKEWNRLMTTHVMDDGNKARPYYLVWSIVSKYTENDKGDWYAPSVKFEGYVTETQYNLTKQERLHLPNRQVDYAQIEGPSIEATAF